MKQQSNLNRIVRKRKTGSAGRLGVAPARQPIGADRSTAYPTGIDEDSSSIASPLKEVEGTRTYHAEQELVSSDGLFTLTWTPVNQLTMKDDNGEIVELRLSEP